MGNKTTTNKQTTKLDLLEDRVDRVVGKPMVLHPKIAGAKNVCSVIQFLAQENRQVDDRVIGAKGGGFDSCYDLLFRAGVRRRYFMYSRS